MTRRPSGAGWKASIPYPRHRQALAAVLGLDEADLWPHLRTARRRPEYIQAIYPHSENLHQEAWARLFKAAQREIDILACSGLLLAETPSIFPILLYCARAQVKIRICLRYPDSAMAAHSLVGIRDAVGQVGPFDWTDNTEIRLHHVTLNSCICRADEDLIIGLRAFGIPSSATPVLHLRGDRDTDLVATYLESFERISVGSRPIGKP